jgi:hypothetical protein
VPGSPRGTLNTTTRPRRRLRKHNNRIIPSSIPPNTIKKTPQVGSPLDCGELEDEAAFEKFGAGNPKSLQIIENSVRTELRVLLGLLGQFSNEVDTALIILRGGWVQMQP